MNPSNHSSGLSYDINIVSSNFIPEGKVYTINPGAAVYMASYDKNGPWTKMGTVSEAIELADDEDNPGIRLEHPAFNRFVSCPACPSMDRLKQMIVHINDGHHWTREAIADWLDTLDEQPVFYPQIEEPSSS